MNDAQDVPNAQDHDSGQRPRTSPAPRPHPDEDVQDNGEDQNYNDGAGPVEESDSDAQQYTASVDRGLEVSVNLALVKGNVRITRTQPAQSGMGRYSAVVGHSQRSI